MVKLSRNSANIHRKDGCPKGIEEGPMQDSDFMLFLCWCLEEFVALPEQVN